MSVLHIKKMIEDDTISALLASIEKSCYHQSPYSHWYLKDCLSNQLAKGLTALPFSAPRMFGISGKRDLRNAVRVFVNQRTQSQYFCLHILARAFQNCRVTDHISGFFGTDLDGTHLRIEYAQDTNGFWSEPHTDIADKVFSMHLYLSDDAGHEALGTDLYDTQKQQISRSPFIPNSAMVFIPSYNTFHGFEKRPVSGTRKSLIINYVRPNWRAKDQLAFPGVPVTCFSPIKLDDAKMKENKKYGA
ncbi:MAG: 2OG-Fe(II) oxygenase [Pseudomonadota bacterium]